MIYYSHRGNINGKTELENQPSYIDQAIELGYDVEIDLRKIGSDLYLGHDYPQYLINEKWIDDRCGSLLIHIKEPSVLSIAQHKRYWHYFCHYNDPFTITSQKLTWIHDLSIEPELDTIIPLISKELVYSYDKLGFFGVCSDYILDAKKRFSGENE